MRIFVKYNRAGEILSVSKTERMPDHVENPYAPLGEDESVLELPNKPEYAQAQALDLHGQYRVDVTKKKLVKKS